MALTRKMLKAMGIEEDKIEQIIDAHAETVDSLKDKAEQYEADAKRLKDVQKELDDLKADGGDWQQKYEKEHSDFEAYKSDVEGKAAKANKTAAYRQILLDSGIPEKRVDPVLKASADVIDKIELDKDSKPKNADELTETVKSEWADFIPVTNTTGANTATPPANNGKGVKTKEEIYKMENGRYVLSASERQAELTKLYQSEKGD